MKSCDYNKVLITGGAGFIGVNYARHMLELGLEVVICDNFSRGIGCYYNVKWLQSSPKAKKNLTIHKCDIRDYEKLYEIAKDCDLIIHAAAQTSVPISIKDPRLYFEVNVIGTFNIVEVVRKSGTDAAVINMSSNKVYGKPKMKLKELEKRYEFVKATKGINEYHPTEAQDPYGISKLVSEYYVSLYSKLYGLKATNLRLALTYGPRQWGTEAQGFVAWFCIAYALDKRIRIFGNGKQVRDLLYIDDAVNAIDLAIEYIDKILSLIHI